MRTREIRQVQAEPVRSDEPAGREEARDGYEERIEAIGYACSVIASGVVCTGPSMSPAEVRAGAQRLQAEQQRQKRLAERTAPYFPRQYDNTR